MTKEQSKEQKISKSSESHYPLSEGQKAIWFLSQLNPSSRSYNIYSSVKIKSALDIVAWQQSWTRLIERHSILRTAYVNVDDQIVQKVYSNLDLKLDSPIRIIDAQDWNEDYLVARIFEETDCHFDLTSGSVIRICLFVRSQNEYIQLITMHHIAGDLWSFDILLRELQVLYGLEIAKNHSNPIDTNLKLSSDCRSYNDYVYWHSEILERARSKELHKYWKEQLSGELPIVNLPFQKQAIGSQAVNGISLIAVINPNLSEKLRQFAEANAVSLYRVMLTAFIVLLYRYIGYEEIVVGSPMAGRWGQKEFKHIVGFFSNIVVLRTNLAGNPTFRELLARVDEDVSSAQAHQDYPFSHLIRQSPNPNSSRNADLINIVFNWQKQRWLQTENAKNILEMEPILIGHQRGIPFNLSLSIMEAGDRLQAHWRYNPDLFTESAIVSMAGHYQNLLDTILENPNQLISRLPILSQSERNQLLMEWNQTDAEYPVDQCIHHLFEQQVQKTPEAIAVVCGNQQLTYASLNQRANQVARYLVNYGTVSPRNLIIGIYMERSVEMIVGLLGILKAGAAYLPLDPNYPQERLIYILADSHAPILLTQKKLVNSFSTTIEMICIEDIPIREEQGNINSNVSPQDLAYVIYTSGSTGQAKGVKIRHQGLVNVMFYRVTQLLNQDDLKAISLTAPLSFDASVGQLFAPLLAGGMSVIADNLFSLPTSSQFQEITCIGSTPSIIDKFIDDFSFPNSLRTIILGGEAVSQSLLDKLIARTKVSKVINLYGPTEATVHCTAAVLFDRTENKKKESPNIGRPIANTRIYILDSELQPVPINIVGELYIGGVGVAQGYLHQPNLTDQKFIVNPYTQSTSYLYKTGDLACYLPDGNIQFLGRIDSQLKIRGFRVELEEIESALAQHSSIKEVVAIACKDNLENNQLVAYFTTTKMIGTEELRIFLGQKLPSYMIPKYFVELTKFSLTPNGKIDRQNVPLDLLVEVRSVSEDFVTPRDDVERKLAQLWSKILEVDRISIYDNFFELGGDSLLSAQFFSKLGRIFQVDLPLSTIFEAQTIEKLAKIIQSKVKLSPWQPLVAITPIKDNNCFAPLFCVSGIYGNVLLFASLAKYLGEAQPFYGLQSKGLDGSQHPHTSIEEMASYYIKAIKSVQPQGPYFLGGFSLGSKVVWEMAQQLHRQDEKVALLVLFDGSTTATKIVRLPFSKRIFRISQNLRKIGFTYIFQKFSSWREWISERYDYWTKKFIRNIFQQFQITLPIDLRQLEIAESLEKAGTQAIKNYVIQSYSGKVILFRAENQSVCQGVGFVLPDWDLGWGKFTTGELEIQPITSDHFSMFNEPQVCELAQKLRECLHKARKEMETNVDDTAYGDRG